MIDQGYLQTLPPADRPILMREIGRMLAADPREDLNTEPTPELDEDTDEPVEAPADETDGDDPEVGGES